MKKGGGLFTADEIDSLFRNPSKFVDAKPKEGDSTSKKNNSKTKAAPAPAPAVAACAKKKQTAEGNKKKSENGARDAINEKKNRSNDANNASKKIAAQQNNGDSDDANKKRKRSENGDKDSKSNKTGVSGNSSAAKNTKASTSTKGAADAKLDSKKKPRLDAKKTDAENTKVASSVQRSTDSPTPAVTANSAGAVPTKSLIRTIVQNLNSKKPSPATAVSTANANVDSIAQLSPQEIEKKRLEQKREDMAVSASIKDRNGKLELQKAKEAKDLIAFNNIIAKYGHKKMLSISLRAYFDALDCGLQPTVYTFTSLINACVRCDEIDRAKHYMNEMIAAGVAPNEVTYTALIKGLSQHNHMKEAVAMVNLMKSKGISPNIRTFNTILRSAWRHGKLATAKKMFAEMKTLGIEPDHTSYEYLARAHCQALQTYEAWNLIAEMKSHGFDVPPQVFSALAITSALLNDLEGANNAIALAEGALADQKEKASSGQKMNGEEDEDEGPQEQNIDDATERSHSRFLQLQHEEVERECDLVREYIKQVEAKQIKPNKGEFFGRERTMFFPRADKSLLDFPKIFGNNKPVRLEVCSGHGDWLVERAANDPDSNWIGLEIRYERVFKIMSKMTFRDLDNMLVLGGEGHLILDNYVPDRCFDEIFVNYPDPPVWEGSKFRIIDKEFLLAAHRTLKEGCALTIVTDDVGYAKMAADEFADFINLFKSAFGKKGFANTVPEGYGSSYFDRMWQKGNRTKRYYLRYIKQ